MTDPNLTEQLETEKAETAAVLEADNPGKTQEDDMTEKITQEQRAHLREVAGIIEFNLTNGYVVAGYAFEVVNLAIPLLDEVERLEKAGNALDEWIDGLFPNEIITDHDLARIVDLRNNWREALKGGRK